METKKMIIVGTNTLLQMAKQLKDRGEITQSQYDDMEKRNATVVPEEWKDNRIILEVEK